MACSRGAASPDTHTQRMLFAASAGYCQNPACTRELFIEYPTTRIHIAEMAHVFAANDDGPRANPSLKAEERGAFENLILLCPSCHTIVDKAPEQYPDSLILEWKHAHAGKLRALFGVTSFERRADALAAIEGLLIENHQVFIDYGPHTDDAKNPESGAAERWKRKILQKILPNNHRILAQLDANKHLLDGSELTTLEKFRQHVDDLEARHVAGFREGASQFPESMSKILKD